MKYTINPYKTRAGHWTFIDPNTNRTEDENELVAGIDTMLDILKRSLGKFSVTFSNEDLSMDSDFAMKLKWLHGDKKNEARTGNYYVDMATGDEGWLCSVLFDYFKEAPDVLYLYVNRI